MLHNREHTALARRARGRQGRGFLEYPVEWKMGYGASKVFYDSTGNTLTVWFGEPKDEYVCEEISDDVILMKDRTGRVIGFEKLNFSGSPSDKLHFSFEILSS